MFFTNFSFCAVRNFFSHNNCTIFSCSDFLQNRINTRIKLIQKYKTKRCEFPYCVTSHWQTTLHLPFDVFFRPLFTVCARKRHAYALFSPKCVIYPSIYRYNDIDIWNVYACMQNDIFGIDLSDRLYDEQYGRKTKHSKWKTIKRAMI